MQEAYLNFQRKQLKKISPATFKHGIISAVHKQSWTADVIVEGDVQTVLRNIPMSSAVPYNVQPGQRCRVDMFDETNPQDSVVAYTYGVAPPPNLIIKSGTYNVTNNGTPIPHGLGAVPDFYAVYGFDQNGGFTAYPPSNPNYRADATNIYVHRWGSPGTILVDWVAILIPNKNF